MKKLITLSMILLSMIASAELASWGMTENQYKLPNFASKMGEIGAQATKNNWLLKVTAPNDWHNSIRSALNADGARDVQVTFKDSLYNSIAISAVAGAKIAQISSSGNNGVTVQKQVVIDKPEIDTEVEAPDFGDTDFKSNTNELLEGIGQMQIEVPTGTTAASSEAKPVAKPAPARPKTVAQAPAAALPPAAEASKEANREALRKRHARTKRVEKLLSYANIKDKDELFIRGSEVLVKRFINQGVVLYFWMKEDYDPSVHKLVEKGSGKYMKDPTAEAGIEVTDKGQPKAEPEPAEVAETNLNFVAIDTNVDDQDDLRRMHARNKGVTVNIKASQLKSKDVLFVKNQTVLVQRPLTSSQNAFFWLVGDTTIAAEVKKVGKNKFRIQ